MQETQVDAVRRSGSDHALITRHCCYSPVKRSRVIYFFMTMSVLAMRINFSSQWRWTKFENLYESAIQIKSIQRWSVNCVYSHFIAKDRSLIMPSEELKW